MQPGLVERAQHGDADAFAAILRDPHRTQDATQQALLNAWQGLPTLRNGDRFEAWLHRLHVQLPWSSAAP